MRRDFFVTFILASMFVVLISHHGAEAAGLRDFLPKAGSVAKYEVIRVYKTSTSTIKGTNYIDWREEEGRQYLVRVWKAKEKKHGFRVRS